MNKLTLIAISFSFPFLSACTPSMPTLPDFPDMPDILPDMSLPTLYKDDIQQGSVLTRFKINQLKAGMSKAQVQDLIGSPSISDPFHNNQWDYINHSTRHEKDDTHYRLVLKFTNQKLTTIDTSGITSLDKLTDKEKALEDQRIAAEKAKIKAQKLAKEKARIAKEKRATEEKRIAKEKIAQEQAAAALKKRIKLEQAQQHQIEQQNAIKTAELKKAQAEQQLEQQKISAEKLQEAVEKTKTEEKPKEVETPWYKFW
ncbi:outer membrane protein assembly factor BamE [Candidatus Thioglobus sp.]|jgi:outer membrane protein assembly factor BamE|uniref:outer membrane protein assembly factor BamE n=1 Tax=Candidatus Thioglobus sp. TaxID=2026721 RepID=UPI001D452787|nr:outer membrane protein assembly factor BamE [Candidatus Thioglobus sp.]MBT3276590.1 outer membrane protein assembly factor BamE [Candidatus Thioglobus sp.]MBT3446679.1 outer membrane protein assembly factor BamE [Candidatus Thioglobus sp.]MBT3744992.1 outer membrane protein assembly factor BamE [Candidatus Thioglobus sp.]MBT4001347.1 outer membrane protein assembly factor BamE [Candidatus Thioglobus sp.]MBT4182037.1 outer membrane protein assembly factor BamE [Candidatus Thioglobus sp.]